MRDTNCSTRWTEIWRYLLTWKINFISAHVWQFNVWSFLIRVFTDYKIVRQVSSTIFSKNSDELVNVKYDTMDIFMWWYYVHSSRHNILKSDKYLQVYYLFLDCKSLVNAKPWIPSTSPRPCDKSSLGPLQDTTKHVSGGPIRLFLRTRLLAPADWRVCN